MSPISRPDSPEIHDSSQPEIDRASVPRSAPISQEEPLARYVTDDDHLNKPPGKVFWRAFRPKPVERELSVARIAELAAEQIWRLGDELAGIPSGRAVIGRADLTLLHVREARVNGVSLDVVPDEPPTRHAVIVGWPDDRDGRKALAMLLAAQSTQAIR